MTDIRRYAHLWLDRGPRLNFGCARNQLEGFVNADIDPRCEPDVLLNGRVLPWPESYFEFILMSHVLEHIRDPFPLMGEMWRLLGPGGHVLIIVPHGMSTQQMGTPSHVVSYNAMTFTAFTTQRYENPGDHGYGAYEGKELHPWEILRIDHELKYRWPWGTRWIPMLLEPHVWDLFENIYCVMRRPA